MIDFFLLLLKARPGSTFTILSNSDPSPAKKIVERSGSPADTIEVMSVEPAAVPDLLHRHDVGLVFLGGRHSLMPSSPTKLAEYLASGLVVVAEAAIGEIKRIIVDSGTGCLIDSSNRGDWPGVLRRLLDLCDQPDFRSRSVRAAGQFYALPIAIERYAAAYQYAGHPRRSQRLRK
jgi:hypothetical protein